MMLVTARSSRQPRTALFAMLFVVAAVLGVSSTSARAAEPSIAGDERTVRLNPPQMFRLADQLLARGSTAQAMQILELLARNPDSDVRNEARFRRSKLLEAIGDFAQLENVALGRELRLVDEDAVELSLPELIADCGEQV
ncbi:tetratricopeptide repeat protein, partial [Sphingomonas segetis]|uniref:tetratricopeptide repeat protein n=1 Tax=Sphingomonas segetis TaxID=1104779 RepID=UPI003B846CFD